MSNILGAPVVGYSKSICIVVTLTVSTGRRQHGEVPYADQHRVTLPTDCAVMVFLDMFSHESLIRGELLST